MVQTLISQAAPFAPIVYEKIKDALYQDSHHWYGVVHPVDYGVIKTERFRPFDFINDALCIEKVDEQRIHLWVKAFDASKKWWDGTSCLPDKGTKDLDALFKASLIHDLIYQFVEDLAKAAGCKEEDMLAFADDLLKIYAVGYGASPKIVNPIYQLLRFGGSMYHKIHKIFAIVAVLLLTGCYTVKTTVEDPPPDISWIGPFFSFLTNSIPADVQINIQTNEVPSTTIPETSTAIPETPSKPQSPQSASEGLKISSFGSPNTSKATEDPNAQIKDLKMDRNGMSYRWAKGGCENLGATSKSDYDHTIAVAGWSNDGKTFKCGKFDWISTSRTTRSFENIHSGYNGFKPDEFFNAKRRCFFIMSADGKKRTNILVY